MADSIWVLVCTCVCVCLAVKTSQASFTLNTSINHANYSRSTLGVAGMVED